MIQLQNVSKRYPNSRQALSDLSFHVQVGEMVFLTGHSGAGKSTLLKLISLIESPSRGQMTVNSVNYHKLSARKIPYVRRQIGMIFQNPMLLPKRTVFDNVALPLIIAGHHHLEVKRRTQAVLDKVNLLNKAKVYPLSLSGGEQQRVSIARALVDKPALILADEPTGNLDPELSREIMQLFEQFNELGVTLLIASHDVSLISTLSYRVLT